ncbi:hypothetical protein [Oceanobacillus massiliensis]|uniref:hypothetical protein n=1 Tax=Oceanobacillus massiliensis TaxID=1465765 RepID=UPI0002898085|nr:hypothetical protein [Oceanobacillus massiliensis]
MESTANPNVVYYTERIQKELIDILDDLLFYHDYYNGDTVSRNLEILVSHIQISEEWKRILYLQLYWMAIFCLPDDAEDLTVYQQFLRENKKRLLSKNSKLRDILISWSDIKPGLYRVIKSKDGRGKILLFQDAVSMEIKQVCFYSKKISTPKIGELAAGVLIPFDDDTYITMNELICISDLPETGRDVLLLAQKYFAPGREEYSFFGFIHFIEATHMLCK